MKNIAIIGSNARSKKVVELLKNEGYSASIIEGDKVPDDTFVFGINITADGVIDLNKDELFAKANAIPAAEAALEIAMQNMDKTISGSRCLVLGCGRIGRVLARSLSQIGADVDTYDLIFNTIPEKVLSDDVAGKIPESSVVIDLASNPGGDLPGAIRALGLPSKHTPVSAAEIMKNSILRYVKEDYSENGVVAESNPMTNEGNCVTNQVDDGVDEEKPNNAGEKKTTKSESIRIGFALTGSFCTIPAILPIIKQIASSGAQITPIVSESVASISTRFGATHETLGELEEICGRAVISDILQAETIGPANNLDVMVIAPATGNTIAKIACGVTDTSVTMAAKAHLRNGKPLIIAPSTNDGLGNAAKNIGQLLNMRNVYFVPFGQDNPKDKPRSLVANMTQISASIEAALKGEQLQPILI